MSLPLVMGPAGAVPQSPSSLLAQLLGLATTASPGLTANLPGSLVEDVSATDVASLTLCDSAQVETINSVTPYGCNAFILTQLGNIYGVPLGLGFNASVFVQFTGPPGFVIGIGFTVSDGANQYTIQDGGIIPTSGATALLFCVATQSGSWAIPAGSVTQIVTSVPSTVTLTVTNPQPGVTQSSPQDETDYRAQVLTAGLASSTGMVRLLKTLLGNVVGVQSRLVSAVPQSGGGYEIICGGGDPYQVAYAIWTALFDTTTLVGSTLLISGVTKASPGVATTALNHGLVTGQNNVNIAGALGMTSINGGPYTVTVIDEKTFSFGVNTTGAPTYTGGGVVTPNTRNIVADVYDYPDTYPVPYVSPPSQVVNIAQTWNTTATNFVSPSAVAQLGSPALVAYVNSIAVGVPINLFDLQSVFQAAVISLVPTEQLTRMVFVVEINGVVVSPSSGTGIIAGDPESYFMTDSTQISIVQG